MTSSEARDLMAQNSHDVTILDGEQADAINLANIRNNSDVIIGDNDNQIMVLESGQKSGSMSMDGIEILEDKDIRILEGKGLDDRFVDGITFLSQTKIDDLLLGPKSLAIDGEDALAGHDDGKRNDGAIPRVTASYRYSSRCPQNLPRFLRFLFFDRYLLKVDS